MSSSSIANDRETTKGRCQARKGFSDPTHSQLIHREQVKGDWRVIGLMWIST